MAPRCSRPSASGRTAPPATPAACGGALAAPARPPARDDLRARTQLVLPLDDDEVARREALPEQRLITLDGVDRHRPRLGGPGRARDVDERPLRPALDRDGRHDERALAHGELEPRLDELV